MLVLTPVITPLSSLMSGLLESLNFSSSSLPDWILHFVAADVDVDDGVKEDPGAGDLVDRVGELRGDEVPGVPHDQVQDCLRVDHVDGDGGPQQEPGVLQPVRTRAWMTCKRIIVLTFFIILLSER